MKKFILSLLVIGLASQVYSQITKVEELSEVVVTAVNYKYLNQTDNKEAAVPVQMLQRKVAAYDVTTKDYYQDDYDYYTVEFYIPDGKIVAAYDTDGKILKTIEKFNDIKLPAAVSKALLDRFPNWTVAKDVYRVNYTDKKGAMKVYKLKLENGEKTMRVKMNEDGEFL
ncbi:nicotinate-nucleotide adenylyltransferase [uncultured Eudoraea sp.]|uniref:nicotinate-nucleotide adenylyltransferase n=1 Tax=uncultured Eudoraea sp. TaxID=1035614 RepID=UPI0026150F30|nr:nicotinate-nucleotide adenylyltransferase [uncultured Eudoraea sp.]